MLLSDAKLGDVVLFYLHDNNMLSSVPTAKTMPGTIIALGEDKGPTKPRFTLVGFKDSRPFTAFHRPAGNASLAIGCDYIPEQADYKYAERITYPYEILIDSIVSVAQRTTSPRKAMTPVTLDIETEYCRILTAPAKGNCACNLPRSSCTYHQ